MCVKFIVFTTIIVWRSFSFVSSFILWKKHVSVEYHNTDIPHNSSKWSLSIVFLFSLKSQYGSIIVNYSMVVTEVEYMCILVCAYTHTPPFTFTLLSSICAKEWFPFVEILATEMWLVKSSISQPFLTWQ